MDAPLRFTLLILALASIMGLSGCLERRERIIVGLDGTVEFRLLVESEDLKDIDQGDRLPQPGGSWQVQRSIHETPQGKQVHRLTALRRLPSGVPLPSSFAERGDPLGEAYLQFPTTLRMEQRTDGWYYHFSRTYEPRAYAQIGFLQDIAGEQAEKYTQNLAEGEALGATEIKGVSEIMVKFAVSKIETFAREAFRDTNPNTPQDAWLVVRDALDELRRNADYDRLAAILQSAGEEGNSKVFENLAAEFDTATTDTIIAALASSPYVVDTGAFRRRFEFHKKAFEITEDIGDDRFEITVQMPGTIVGHNGDSRSGDSVTWTFPGKMLYDRRIELLVTSRVAN